jgi:aspartyl-tRNA(Asn)/glutamyl-tRNA(Gln) amidotransferase subunit B
VKQAIEANPGPLEQYLEGKDAIFGFFIGQVMRASRGRADPQVVRTVLGEQLGRLRNGA